METVNESELAEFADEFELDLSNSNDRCWLAGWLQASSNLLRSCGTQKYYARICISLEVPENHKEWAKEILK